MLRNKGRCLLAGLFVIATTHAEIPWPELSPAPDARPLPGTAPLTLNGDLASTLLEGAHRFLDRKIQEAASTRRQRPPSRDLQGLSKMVGMSDRRLSPAAFEYYTDKPGRLALAETDHYAVFTVRWPVYEGLDGEGLLFVPKKELVADIIYVPDPGTFPDWENGDALARAGCRVLVPLMVNRDPSAHNMSRRDWLYRPAYELGRHLIGYEVDILLGGAEGLLATTGPARPLGIAGVGEGGLSVLIAATFQEYFSTVLISGYFEPREGVANEPAYRTLFGRLNHWGDAELAAQIAPRKLVLHNGSYPELEVLPGTRAKPGVLRAPSAEAFASEEAHLLQIAPDLKYTRAEENPLAVFYKQLTEKEWGVEKAEHPEPDLLRTNPFLMWRPLAQIRQMDAYNQQLLRESVGARSAHWKRLKTDTLEHFERTVEPYRIQFRDEIVGHFEEPRLPANPRTRKVYTTEGVTIYEVVLDVFPEVIALGLLLVPQDIKPGQRRPVVVCQHGLEGRPRHVIGEEKYGAYKAFATRLAQEGFVTFAPQNLYLFGDRFRSLQFKANAIGASIFSIMVPQHRQITDWLGELDFVDTQRIGFYGLSYGGKSAMRIPPLVPAYKAVICSADFNDWIWKNASTHSKYSYAPLGEYEIFEWNLGRTFNYSDMAALIAPRPFMVERGHYDGVAPDDRVAAEFARVRRLYTKLGIVERAEIEWFDGPHTINGKGTFAFLHQHLGPVKE